MKSMKGNLLSFDWWDERCEKYVKQRLCLINDKWQNDNAEKIEAAARFNNPNLIQPFSGCSWQCVFLFSDTFSSKWWKYCYLLHRFHIEYGANISMIFYIVLLLWKSIFKIPFLLRQFKEKLDSSPSIRGVEETVRKIKRIMEGHLGWIVYTLRTKSWVNDGRRCVFYYYILENNECIPDNWPDT